MCTPQMLPQTANVEGRAERSRAGTHTRLQLLCQTLQPVTAAFVGMRSTPLTNGEAGSTAAPLSTESVLVPLRIFFFSLYTGTAQSWPCHELTLKLYHDHEAVASDSPAGPHLAQTEC